MKIWDKYAKLWEIGLRHGGSFMAGIIVMVVVSTIAWTILLTFMIDWNCNA